jgi:prolyl-tRNA editing enzyme YbaK/EbsC (Cys-tRNA(Pro) deacylase)
VRGSIEVHRYLTERDVPHEFYRLERPLRRLDEAAALLGLDPTMVVSGELFEIVGGHVLALLPSSMCASVEAVARATGKPRSRPLSKVRVIAHTGFLPDWLPPVGHERPSRALVDETLLDADVLYTPGGDPGVMLTLRSADLVRATAADVVALTGPAEDAELPSAATPGLR